MVVHRDEFQRFHRHKRTVASRTAKAVKAWLENMEMRKEKADNREGEFSPDLHSYWHISSIDHVAFVCLQRLVDFKL